ncbi:Arp2/3 complex 16 kDa subunit ARPC5 [Eremomyces bilateralis CBS 781.70]|uniref:Actin-related protein 2/3 complex subunit 5 n=1 Tax=Eremomyces bilateralis CBS 781.70 TaxID=1392243 RepID=A0A6G1GE23_9PEZI|nr:Arp2/3 complex 16 kDa subunit ARPC5 [Eremomyces bilateralis CBS 781.70]KAF1816347.1 Arp2/3 complex 16 kDa subunit ARPC5 [Eremomyces bilateralis CBS 781.70]
MAAINWRTINIDALDPEASTNFDLASLSPPVAQVSASDVQNLAGQIRQLLRGGDTEGALRGALESAPYGSDERGKELHLATVIEILQSIRQSDMTPLLQRIYQSPGGSELLDVLMKYLYRGMAQATPLGSKTDSPQPTGFSQISGRGTAEGGGQAMSVLLSWHEKTVEIAGQGSIVRVMTDRRTV